MKDPEDLLTTQVQQFYSEIELSPELTVRMLRERKRNTRGGKARLFFRVLGSVAALAVLLTALFVLLQPSSPSVSALAMSEVAQNHRKGIASEITTDNYEEVQSHLASLGFSILPPKESLLSDYELLGGRHCKVQGEFAAQLKIRKRAGGPEATAYLVPANGPLASIETGSKMVDGVQIRCERLGARLFFIAEDTQ